MSGRGAGRCAGFDVPGSAGRGFGRGGRGRGFGFGGGGRGFGGRGRGFGWAQREADERFAAPVAEAGQEQQVLRNQADILRARLHTIEQRLAEGEKQGGDGAE